MLDATRLRVLVAVARYGSVTAAAHALNYAQPSISHHIARLEAETGAKLLERAGRGIRLTEAGQLLAERAEDILGRIDAAEAELASHVSLRQDRVRLAAFGTALSTLIATAAIALRSEHRGADLQVIDAHPAQALHLLRAGEVDVAIIFRYLVDGAEPAQLAGDFTSRPVDAHGEVLLDEPVYLITASAEPEPEPEPRAEPEPQPGREPGAEETSTELSAVLSTQKDHQWIATSELCDELLLDLCRRGSFTPRVIRTSDHLTAQALVAAGLGVTVLPGLALRAARHPGLRSTELPGVRRQVLAFPYPASPDPAAVSRLLKLAR
jgi:DNA-binding transcriptional LysR family regulator